MKKTPLTITLPKPCSEDWGDMSPVEGGRFCASCQKNVIDFTNLTDTQIINIFKAAKGIQPCGRYHVSQLNRELIEVKKLPFSTALLKRVAASLLFFQTIVTTVLAQTTRQGTTQRAASAKGTKKQAHTRTVHGKVIDFATNELLHGMMVQINGTELKAITDKAGCFRIALPDSLIAKTFTLTARYTDQSSKELRGTILVETEISIEDVLAGKEIIVYRYAKDDMASVTVSEYKPKMIFVGEAEAPRVLDGVQIPVEQPKTSFWQKITSPLRKKKKENVP